MGHEHAARPGGRGSEACNRERIFMVGRLAPNCCSADYSERACDATKGVFREPQYKIQLDLLQTIRSRLFRIASNQIQQSLARDIGGSVDRDSTREDQPTLKKIREESHGTSPRQKGSFTIVNPKVEQNWDSLPLGNKLFPELVVAVFDLETNLAKAENAT